VSLNADGTASPDGLSHSPSISADGLTVAFVSHATNLVEGVTNKLGEVYVRQVATGSTRWAMASHLGETRRDPTSTNPWRWPPLGTAPIDPYVASEPVLSADGRYVAFTTLGHFVRFDLSRDTNYIHFTFTNRFTIDGVRVDFFRFADNPRVAPGSTNGLVALSSSFRWLAYPTASNLWPYPGIWQLEWDNLATNISSGHVTSPSGQPITSYLTNVIPVSAIAVTNFTRDGSTDRLTWSRLTWLGLNSDGQRLFLVGDMRTNVHPFVPLPTSLGAVDLPGDSIRFVITNGTSEAGASLEASDPQLLPDGSLIAWDSPDDNIVADDLNRAWDVFVRNVDTGEMRTISALSPELPTSTGTAMAKTAGNQSISGDGSRVVVLASDGNVIPDDTNRLADAALRDLLGKTNSALSGRFAVKPLVGPTALSQPTNLVFTASLSLDGRYAMFAGNGHDVRFGGFYGTNIFWRDLYLNTNDYVSGSTTGGRPALSTDGRLVAYEKLYVWYIGPDLSISEANNASDILIRDYRTVPARLVLISAQTNRQELNGRLLVSTANGSSINPVFGPDSRWVVFQSLATDLTYDTGSVSDYQLYAREIDTTFIKRISYSGSEGTNAFPLSGGATNPVFSADARFVFFEGSTSNLIYRHDLLNDMDDAGTARRPNLVVCTGCANPSASSEGRFVSYESRPGPGGGTNIVLKDLANGQVELVSVSMTGTNGNGASFTPLLSHDARFVVFASRASDLVPGDNNRATDIFVRDRFAGATHCLSRNLAGTGTGNRVSSNPIMSADGRTVAFQSFASDLVPGDYNDTRDVFVVTLGGPDTDGDGMEDDWELAYFSTLDRDGSGDFDSDGASDLDEFRAGTNPANDASILQVLRLTTFLAAGPNPRRTTVLLWSASPGKTYRVQAKTSLDDVWTTVGADITASSTTASQTDTVEVDDGPNDPHRFYRVLLVQ
jgi:Tol biopolymer transport system component